MPGVQAWQRGQRGRVSLLHFSVSGGDRRIFSEQPRESLPHAGIRTRALLSSADAVTDPQGGHSPWDGVGEGAIGGTASLTGSEEKSDAHVQERTLWVRGVRLGAAPGLPWQLSSLHCDGLGPFILSVSYHFTCTPDT